MLVEVLATKDIELVLRLDVMDGDSAVFDQLLDEGVFQRDVPGGGRFDGRPHEAPTYYR